MQISFIAWTIVRHVGALMQRPAKQDIATHRLGTRHLLIGDDNRSRGACEILQNCVQLDRVQDFQRVLTAIFPFFRPYRVAFISTAKAENLDGDEFSATPVDIFFT